MHDFNPRFPRGKRPDVDGVIIVGIVISIHASRGGSDRFPLACLMISSNFNPRFPRGKRLTVADFMAEWLEFQSTLPAGEAT